MRPVHIVVTQPELSRPDHAGNLRAIRAIAAAIGAQQQRPDFLLLPELFFRTNDLQAYEQFVREIAEQTGACVIGGSLHARIPPDEEELYNGGFVMAPDGRIVACYTKQHPYGNESGLGIMPGTGLCQFTWKGYRCAVLICADMWDSRLLSRLTEPPDLLCVVAASVSQEHGPTAARNLWHALGVARAFELTSAVAISDWAEGPVEESRSTKHEARSTKSTCAVAGLADPSDLTGRFHQVPTNAHWHAFTIDLDQLHRLRTARKARHFYFWPSGNNE